MRSPRVLIIVGCGFNCEAESRYAWEQAGAEVSFVHFNDVLSCPKMLLNFQGLMFIGGFSYGDHMGSGHVFASRVKNHLGQALEDFISAGKIVLGVCNGFQVMARIGLLPGLDGEYFEQKIAITQNDCGTFQNFWIKLAFDQKSPCIFTKGLSFLHLPIRHGEGKIVTDDFVLKRMEHMHCLVCRYIDPFTNEATNRWPYNPNGAFKAVAGICDPTGRVFGLMPHPEAYLFPENHPKWDFLKHQKTLSSQTLGEQIFQNAVKHLSSI